MGKHVKKIMLKNILENDFNSKIIIKIKKINNQRNNILSDFLILSKYNKIPYT